MIDEIARLGATHVALVVSWAQPDIRSNRIARKPGVTASDRLLRRALRRARARGLATIVFPILTVDRTRTGEWRGTVAPRSPAVWWRSYERFILHYAAIAAAEKAEVMLVGSELGSTEGWRERWNHLIGQVKRRFDGPVAYSANWDHYHRVSFWRRLDILGVTGYFELTSDRDASVADLTRAWARQRDRLVAFAATRPGVELWLSEVGYVSRDGAATRPWDYHLATRIDLEEQRRCYRALRAAWSGVAALRGVVIWNWYGAGGAADGGYTPKGKPAERVLRDWWR
jgi:hypothetical protein